MQCESQMGFLVSHPRARQIHSPGLACPGQAPPPPPRKRRERGAELSMPSLLLPQIYKLIIDDGSTSPGQREEGAEGGQSYTHHTVSMRKERVGMGKDLFPQWGGCFSFLFSLLTNT